MRRDGGAEFYPCLRKHSGAYFGWQQGNEVFAVGKFARSAKKPNKDGINLLVSILVCYPEIGMVSYEPEKEALDFSFTLQKIPPRKEFEEIAAFLEESILTYHDLEGLVPGEIDFSLEGQGNTAFFRVLRDVRTLSRGEIALLADLMRDRFGKSLVSDQMRDVYEEDNFLREEAIDHMIGSLKASRMSDRMIGIREEGRVMVFNK